MVDARADVFALFDLQVDDEHFRNEHVFTTWKSCELPRAHIEVQVKALEAGKFSLTVSTYAPVFYLTLNAEGIGGEFDDNCFALLPN